MTPRLAFRLLTGLALLAASLGVTPAPVHAADGVVGDVSGNPALCTEAAFNTVLSTVQSSGSGTITFNCGPAMHTIVFTAPKPINSAVTIDGGGRITLSGGDSTSLFTVNFGDSLTLRGLTLTRSRGPSAAIGNLGRLDVIDSQLVANFATNGAGGAISSIGTAALTNTLIISNTTSQNGGGLHNGGTMTISGGQISGNLATTTGGGLHNAGTLTITGGLISGNEATQDDGGGIYNANLLTIIGSQISGNRVNDAGGGIYNGGTLMMTQASLMNNVAVNGGGLSSNATTRIYDSVVQANSARHGGGIQQVGGVLTLYQVLLADNGDNNDAEGSAERGGGAHLAGPGVFNLIAVTVWRNRADFGGGIAQYEGSLTLRNGTLSENRAVAVGGGLYFLTGSTLLNQVTVTDNILQGRNPALGGGAGVYFVESGGGDLWLTNTLLTGNRWISTLAANCGGAGPTVSFSLSSDGTCAFGAGRDNIALPLGPLQNNGGLMPTHLLPAGSPAIDAGTNTGCPAVDQRGLARPVGAACDVGAVEARPEDFVTRLYLPALQK